MNAITTPPIAVLVAALRHAKKVEEDAKAHRMEIEAQILALCPAPESGEGMHKDEEFDIAYRLIRSVDTAKLQTDWSKLPTEAQKAFRWSADVDLRNLRALSEDNAYIAQSYITAKPAKPAIKLKEHNE